MKIRIDVKSSHSAVIVLQRTFDSTRGEVWDALTDPKLAAQWYGGSGVEEMDVRPGGLWRHVTRGPDGEEQKVEFTFGEVVKPEKLTWKSAEHRMTLTLAAAGDDTEWKLVVRFNSYAERDAAAKAGFAKVLAEGTEKLDALLKG